MRRFRSSRLATTGDHASSDQAESKEDGSRAAVWNVQWGRHGRGEVEQVRVHILVGREGPRTDCIIKAGDTYHSYTLKEYAIAAWRFVNTADARQQKAEAWTTEECQRSEGVGIVKRHMGGIETAQGEVILGGDIHHAVYAARESHPVRTSIDTDRAAELEREAEIAHDWNG